MPRYRRRSYRRRKQNVRWNPYFKESLTAAADFPSDSEKEFKVLDASIVPIGRSGPDIPGVVERPINDNTVERIRGEIFTENNTNKDLAMCFTASVFPKEYADAIVKDNQLHPTVNSNEDYDDYLMFAPIACINTDGGPVVKEVDNKAKRKLPVGDFLVFACHVLVLSTSLPSSGNVICASFQRILTKLQL